MIGTMKASYTLIRLALIDRENKNICSMIGVFLPLTKVNFFLLRQLFESLSKTTLHAQNEQIFQ